MHIYWIDYDDFMLLEKTYIRDKRLLDSISTMQDFTRIMPVNGDYRKILSYYNHWVMGINSTNPLVTTRPSTEQALLSLKRTLLIERRRLTSLVYKQKYRLDRLADYYNKSNLNNRKTK